MTNTPTKITVLELSKLSGMQPRRIYDIIAEGKMTPTKRGKLEYPECVTELFAFLQRDAAEIQRERLRLTRARADEMEKKAGVFGQTLYTKEQVKANLAEVVRMLWLAFSRELSPPGSPGKTTLERVSFLQTLCAPNWTEAHTSAFIGADHQIEENVLRRIHNKCNELANGADV